MLLIPLCSAVLLCSCTQYQEVLKGEDVELKYAMADSLYQAGKYKKALKLMEQIVPTFRGKSQAEDLMFKYANTFYKLEDYYLAGYQFERFVTSYPGSDSVEVAAYRSAKSYYELSPRFSLDQKDTNKALEQLQIYIDTYPESQYRGEANQLVKELREKLEKKDYEVARQFLNISDYKAAIGAFDNFIADHPGAPLRKEAFFYRFVAQYELAINSFPSLVAERLEEAKGYYNSFNKYYSTSEYSEEANEIMADIQQRLSEQSESLE
jgi:outer membrane protein assembly factor BamD